VRRAGLRPTSTPAPAAPSEVGTCQGEVISYRLLFNAGEGLRGRGHSRQAPRDVSRRPVFPEAPLFRWVALLRWPVCALVSLLFWAFPMEALAYVSSNAPLCDERAAVTFGPAPTLLVPLASLGAPDDDGFDAHRACATGARVREEARRGEAPRELMSGTSDMALPVTFAPCPQPAGDSGPLHRSGERKGPASGFGSGIDRPPKA
jgi:hypothetical protein